MIIPNILVSVSGLPKSGKNHFAYTFPAPIKVYCFNGGADFVRTRFAEKEIVVHNFILPIVESEIEEWALPVWAEFYQEYNKDIASGKYETYVFDTGTEIETFCHQAILEELRETASEKGKQKQKLAPNEYLARNLRMNAMFARARNAGVNLVTLQYLRQEWVKGEGRDRAEPTGKLVLDGWQQTEAQADINIWMEAKRIVVKGKERTAMIAAIKSNRFDRDRNGENFVDTNYEELVTMLFGG